MNTDSTKLEKVNLRDSLKSETRYRVIIPSAQF